MATVAMPPKLVDQRPSLPLYRFTVRQYHRMIQAGILTENDPVELLEGWIVTRMPHNPPHDGTISRLNRRLMRLLSEEWLIRIQSSITTKDSEPEPDLALVRGPDETYFSRHPRPRDIALLIEVANATLRQDREEKGRLYARARIPVYWIANLVDSIIEVYTDPKVGRSPAYRQRQDYNKQDAIPLIIEGTVLGTTPVRELLP